MIEEKRASCPLDCFDLCRFIARIQDQTIVSLSGDPDHPLTQGVICPKGRGLLKRMNHPDRLVQPLKKTKAGFTPISHDQALDLMARELTRRMDAHDPTTVINYCGDGYGGLKGRIQSLFFNGLGGDSRPRGSLCWGAGMAAVKLDFGIARAHLPNDILCSDQILIWGRNPKVTNLHLYMLLNKARKNQIPIHVIDPIETETAKALGGHIRIHPGTDGALALGMARVIIKAGLADEEFIAKNVQGYRRFCRSIEDFTLEKTADITGIPAHVIQSLAMDYAQADRGSIWIGYGLQRYESGGNKVRCINALAAICGHVGKKGGGVNYASKSLAGPLGAVERQSESRPLKRRYFAPGRMGNFIQTAKAPPVTAAVIAAANPLVQCPDTLATTRAFQGVEFKVVFDHFMTDTARHADLVLPAAFVFEQEDLFTTSMYSHVLNYSQQLVPPRGGILPEFEFYLALARRMEIDLGFTSSRDFLEQSAAALMADLGLPFDGDLEALNRGYIRNKDHEVAWEKEGFHTPSGKIELFSPRAAEMGLSPLAQYIPPRRGSKAFPLRLLTCKTPSSMHSQGFAFTRELPEVFIRPEVALELGLEGEDRVVVRGEAGRIRARLKLDPGIHKNTAYMHQGWWHVSGAVNVLIPNRESDMGNQAAYYDCFCRLEKETGPVDS